MFWIGWSVLILFLFMISPLLAIAVAIGTFIGLGFVFVLIVMEFFTTPLKARKLAQCREAEHRRNGSRLNNGLAEWWDTAEQRWKPYDHK